ncbi:hypothetical protein GCM10010358_43530 [Streptomyces minutiscleroticus]|uniref:Uncharacterized protein n=1 Tax=Streptomyces minutiscleroticus TaxID=68238 RepID=A0A918NP08_9ACTN|nr:hypothetical protein GCM10010358_43530 [Streptomyces minutiscleroticus]
MGREERLPLSAPAEESVLFPLRERAHCRARLGTAAEAGVASTAVPTAPPRCPARRRPAWASPRSRRRSGSPAGRAWSPFPCAVRATG